MCEYCEREKNPTADCKPLIDDEYHIHSREPVRADVSIRYSIIKEPRLIVSLVSHEGDEWLGCVTCDINYCPMCGRKLGAVDDEQQS